MEQVREMDNYALQRLVCVVILLMLVLVMFWPLLVWSLDDTMIYPAIVVNSIVLISLLFAYMETKSDEGG
jgi:hypothetical protein